MCVCVFVWCLGPVITSWLSDQKGLGSTPNSVMGFFILENYSVLCVNWGFLSFALVLYCIVSIEAPI